MTERKPSLVKRIWHSFTVMFDGWKGIALAVLLGGLIGVGGMTLQAAGFTNYFGDDPRTCNACHAMNPQYNAYLKGSHANVATCNSCHAPHDSFVGKYLNKAENGFMHSLKFTLDNYPKNIKIRPHNKEVTEQACLYCHSEVVDSITHNSIAKDEQLSCIRCHDGVGHKR